MCNLYDAGISPNTEPKAWERRVVSAIAELKNSLNIRKTDTGLVVRNRGGEYNPSPMRWGFSRAFNPAINNARGDKLMQGFWNATWEQKQQRCVVPVSAFYEWTGGRGDKQTYAFRCSESGSLWIAGLWEQNAEIEDHDGRCFTMITTDANFAVSAIHNRMPAIIGDHQMEEFLSAENPIDLIRPWEGDLEIFPCENPLKMTTPSPPIASGIQDELF